MRPSSPGQVRHDPHLDLASSRRSAASRSPRRRRTRGGSAGRPRCGSGCSAGSGRSSDSRPVAAMVCWNVVWMRPSSATDRSSPSTVCRSRIASRCASRCSRNGCSVLHEQVGERRGVGRVAGLDLLGLRHAELVEEDLLELLGRAEVHLAADHRVRVRRRAGDRAVEVPLELGRGSRVGRDAACAPCGPARRRAAARGRSAGGSAPRSPSSPASTSARSATAAARTAAPPALVGCRRARGRARPAPPASASSAVSSRRR